MANAQKLSNKKKTIRRKGLILIITFLIKWTHVCIRRDFSAGKMKFEQWKKDIFFKKINFKIIKTIIERKMVSFFA